MSMKYELHKKSTIHSNGDGYITTSGHTMFQYDIVQDLNYLTIENKRLKKELEEMKAKYKGCCGSAL